MKNALLAVALASVVVYTPAFAQAPSVSDQDFVAKASVGNTFEVEEAKLALDKATDPRLKGFANKMIADHGDAMKKLEAASGKVGDKAAMMLDMPHQSMLDNLKTFSGTDFDKVYIADQVAAHAETVALLSDYKQNGKNGSLMSWTKDALPVVKEHQADINAM
jgi:putative membrane protein